MLDAERQRAFQQIDDVTKELVDDLGSYALTYHGVNLPRLHTSVPVLISRYVYAVRGIQLSDRPFTVKAEIIQELTAPIQTALFGGRWRLARRANAFFELPKVLDKYTSADSSVEGGS